MSRGRTAGLIGGAVGIVAAGAAVGVAVEKYAIGKIRSGDGGPVEAYGALEPDRSRVVVADDGVPLYLEETGPLDAPLTVVFVHGYGLDMGSWHYQRKDLPGRYGAPLRCVFYDHRGHGRSGRGDAGASTVEQLGKDLSAVLCGLDPAGPVLLVGHSLGGMTIMALAQSAPEWFDGPVAGTVLMSTSAGMIPGQRLSLSSALAALRRPFIPVVSRGMIGTPALLERTRRAGSDIAWLLTRRYAFGSDVSPALVSYVEHMIAETPVDVLGEFLPVVMSHDKREALPAVGKVPALVMVGGKDLLTPPEHSADIAENLPGADLVVIEGAGHLVLMEEPEATTAALTDFLRRLA